MNNVVLSGEEIIRAWKDECFFYSLTEEQRQQVEGRFPAGAMELSDSELDQVAGSRKQMVYATATRLCL
jgi:mersacidin/lichenicidin family type 2 lantibiotic